MTDHEHAHQAPEDEVPDTSEDLPPIAAVGAMVAHILTELEVVEDLVSVHRYQAPDFPTRARMAHTAARLSEGWAYLKLAHVQLTREAPEL